MKHGAKLDIKAHFGLTPLDYSALFIAEKNIRIEKDCPFKDELKERMQYSKETGIKIYSELLKEEESEMQIDKELENQNGLTHMEIKNAGKSFWNYFRPEIMTWD